MCAEGCHSKSLMPQITLFQAIGCPIADSRMLVPVFYSVIKKSFERNLFFIEKSYCSFNRLKTI